MQAGSPEFEDDLEVDLYLRIGNSGGTKLVQQMKQRKWIDQEMILGGLVECRGGVARHGPTSQASSEGPCSQNILGRRTHLSASCQSRPRHWLILATELRMPQQSFFTLLLSIQ